MNKLICTAIKTRSYLEFFYDGGLRTVQPYCHGLSKSGSEVLSAYQTSGYSESGLASGWKSFDVSKIRALKIADVHFLKNRYDYNVEDCGIHDVHCKVQ